MEPMEWDPEYYGEDFPTEWEPEFLPGLPSPSSALARRFFPPRRRPTRTLPRPTGAPSGPSSPMAAVLDRIKALDERQKATASQLALMQQRTAAQQSSEAFGPLATGAAGAFALGLKGGNAFSPFVTHGLPVAQLLLASRGRAISSGFRANPWSTLGFPIAAVLLTVFRDKIPGLRPTTVDEPEVTLIPDPNTPGSFIVLVRKPKGSVLRFTGPVAVGADPGDPTTGSTAFVAQRLGARENIKLRAFIDGVGSDTVLVATP